MNSPPTPRILVWNAERKSPRGSVGSRIPTFLARHAPDIVLLTEGEVDLMPPGGHTMTARPLPFAHLRPNERRVLAWSREPWTAVEDYQAYEAADPDHPADPSEILPGRIVSGTTATSLGPLHVHAVCIPYAFSRVSWGEPRRRTWEDHLAFLDALVPILTETPADKPTIVGGDFNNFVPRVKGQKRMPYERLTAVFAPPWSIVTAGLTLASPKGPAHPDKPLIDHLAVNAPLTATAIEGFGNLDHDGQRLSDHTGCVVTLARA